MICKKCGKEIPDGSKFCGSCGVSFENKIVKKEIPGNYLEGIKENLVAIIAYLLSIIGSTTALILLIIFSFMLQNDKKDSDVWLKKHGIQALFLSLTPDVVSAVLNEFDVLSYIPVVRTITGTCIDVIVNIVSMICIVFAIIAISKVNRRQDIDIPIIRKIIKNHM